ncbi:hypothetical protein PFMC_02256 [Plasmodium falciparum CAMP/Malaysia]|uniref:Plasmodium RESA N-terminal domain-containing protein n=1 Tax=Plasmodium falciparum (isolate Camp / Malaysia) TaxID=5835 RepID=A0A024X8A6_PLAFC|nr:hypothetical protein PFMC_02256 [Plasmodium falciparum CAMP/Malaysia]
MDGSVYHIYRRKLSELKNVEHSGLRGSNIKDYLKYNGVGTKKKCNNINYNDLSKQFTLEELHTVLDNLEERPSNEDFYGIWNLVLGITKEVFEDKVKYLWLYIEDYLKKYEYQCYHVWDPLYPICVNTKYRTWYNSMHDIGVALSSIDSKCTLDFYNLVKDGASIDEIKNYIYFFIKYYDILKLVLYNERRAIFTERMKNPKRLEI